MADIEDGGTVEVQGSAAKPYILRNVGGVYSCSCPAWRNQSTPIEKRTCKHLRKYRGEAVEKERLGGELPAKATKSSSKGTEPPILLAQKWDQYVDLADWWMSEKLDGVRAYWDGEKFLSRQGNRYHAPDWFVEKLPETPLDGELWIDRKKFQRTVSIVRRQDRSDHWKEVRYVIFDAPKADGGFEDRLEFLNDFIKSSSQEHISILEQQRCAGVSHLQDELARIESLGGEGLMLREPGSNYEIGRSSTLLKVKNFHDAEAVVLAHQPGKGKHKGRMGALVVQLADGTEFSVGTGFSDAQRNEPPAVGSTITFRYQEMTDGGVPRFPSFVRMHEGNPIQVAKPSTSKKPSKKSSKSTSKKVEVAEDSVKRYFEYEDDKSSKFWEITISDTDVIVRYGRIGTDGTTKEKSFADQAAAQTHVEKLIGQKTKKGYEEQGAGEQGG